MSVSSYVWTAVSLRTAFPGQAMQGEGSVVERLRRRKPMLKVENGADGLILVALRYGSESFIRCDLRLVENGCESLQQTVGSDVQSS